MADLFPRRNIYGQPEEDNFLYPQQDLFNMDGGFEFNPQQQDPAIAPYIPETAARDQYNQLIQQVPVRERASLYNRITAGLASLGQGGYEQGRQMLDRPYNEKMQDYGTKVNLAQAAMQDERMRNEQRRLSSGKEADLENKGKDAEIRARHWADMYEIGTERNRVSQENNAQRAQTQLEIQALRDAQANAERERKTTESNAKLEIARERAKTYAQAVMQAGLRLAIDTAGGGKTYLVRPDGTKIDVQIDPETKTELANQGHLHEMKEIEARGENAIDTKKTVSGGTATNINKPLTPNEQHQAYYNRALQLKSIPKFAKIIETDTSNRAFRLVPPSKGVLGMGASSAEEIAVYNEAFKQIFGFGPDEMPTGFALEPYTKPVRNNGPVKPYSSPVIVNDTKPKFTNPLGLNVPPTQVE